MARVAPASTSFLDFGLPHGNEHMDLLEGGGGGGDGGAEDTNLQQSSDLNNDFFDEDSVEALFGEVHDDVQILPQIKGKKSRQHQYTDGPNSNNDIEDTIESNTTRKQGINSLFGDPNERVSNLEEMSISPPGTDSDSTIRQGSNDKHVGYPQPNYETGAFSEPAQAHDTERSSPVFSEENACNGHDDTIASFDDPVESYGLRRNINRLGAVSTHIDVDQSGNYDPEEEARKNSLKTKASKRQKQAQRSKGNSAGIAKRKAKAKPSSRPSDKPPFKRIIRLSIRAMGSVLNITDGKDNWPEDHSIIGSDDEAERRELLSFYRSRASDSPNSAQVPIIDPAGENKDLTGHPEARGCKRCRLQSMYCSMVLDGNHPCGFCQENDIDCHPIIEPVLTVRCKRCEYEGIACSFENKELSNLIENSKCSECLQAGNAQCKPTHMKEYRNKRIDLNQTLYGADRKYRDCTHCREQKKRCSLKKSSGKPPCTQCKKAKIGCHFYDVTAAVEPNSKKTGKRRNDEDSGTDKNAAKSTPTLMERIAPEVYMPSSQLFSAEDIAYMNGETLEARSEDEESALDDASELEMMEDIAGHRGSLTKIRTSFAHPMIFSTKSSGNPDIASYCNFCGMGAFGMVGHFEREVHVIESSDGLGYTEMGNGHREGNDQTMMCQNCTYHRLQIIVCPEHVLQDMGLNSQIDFNNAADDLIVAPGGSSEMQHQLQRWCSLCFSLATQTCCTAQPSLASSEENEPQLIKEGCGLRLCQECACKFAGDYEYDLNAMAAEFDKEPKPVENEESSEYEGEGENVQSTVRADVGLLKADGLLMRCITNGMDD